MISICRPLAQLINQKLSIKCLLSHLPSFFYLSFNNLICSSFFLSSSLFILLSALFPSTPYDFISYILSALCCDLILASS